ncbi:hypothetical protein F9L33_10125 [Amylibacter sp. SFDW26]|uniref:HNH endonuclease n=1 Tax=Amylibacter sp. SFDW26 TaxID=2652722 RepID=UPI0012623AC4|nr:HNH endonuclease [Amylibacter sp. SFDW26]KAB7613722.1 hypothetical protein F9L33_10125 [Amylibacter sp. SFDW26]
MQANRDLGDAGYVNAFGDVFDEVQAEFQSNPGLRQQFNDDQLKALEAGSAKIPNYTWHHHQDAGRMQLVRQRLHNQTGHIGGEAINQGR